KLFGYLFPTLFPYGTGYFEDPIRECLPGTRHIGLAAHAKFLLSNIARFQTHLSLMFVIHNILLIRRSSYNSRLTVRRSWWPRAMAAMREVDSNTLKLLGEKMKAKRAMNDYSRYEPTNDKERAAMELMAYVDYVDDHIPGSTGEIKKMREEIRAISRANGTPTLFFTLNPADIKNPLATFQAGHGIDIEAPFERPDSTYSEFDRAHSVARNPVAAASFYNRMFDLFLGTVLG
ncbi:hypothetical protein CYLTODRAFT_339289, partial [Cylindrobasidium torrendii FP15055 ss-10]